MKTFLIKYKKDIVMLLTSAIIIFMSWQIKTLKQEKKENNNTIDNLTAGIFTYHLKDGRQAAKIAAFEAANLKSLLALESKDSTIQELQKETKRYKKQIKNGGGVVVIEGNTNMGGTVITNPIFNVDGSKPVYRFTSVNEWVSLSGISKSDSTSFNLSVRNKYTVALGYEKKNLFSKAKPFAEVTNANPYTETETIRAFITSSTRVKRWGIGLQGGYGMGKEGFGGYVGVGISYNFIRF